MDLNQYSNKDKILQKSEKIDKLQIRSLQNSSGPFNLSQILPSGNKTEYQLLVNQLQEEIKKSNQSQAQLNQINITQSVYNNATFQIYALNNQTYQFYNNSNYKINRVSTNMRLQDQFCSKCFNQNPQNYFCSLGKDLNTGQCCDQQLASQTGCNATIQSSQFCVQAQNSELQGIKKYTYCAHDMLRCGSQQRKIISDFRKQTIQTTVEFTTDDVCVYEIISNSGLIQMNLNIQLNILQTQEIGIFVLSGQSQSTLDSFQSINQQSNYILDNSKVNYLVAVPLYFNNLSATNLPFLEFTVQNNLVMQPFDILLQYGEYLLAVALLICCLAICIGNLIIKLRIDSYQSEIPDIDKYKDQLKAYKIVGNIWDPEEESKMKAAARQKRPTSSLTNQPAPYGQEQTLHELEEDDDDLPPPMFQTNSKNNNIFNKQNLETQLQEYKQKSPLPQNQGLPPRPPQNQSVKGPQNKNFQRQGTQHAIIAPYLNDLK